MPRATWTAVALIALLALPALTAETTTHAERRVERLVATPTPLGPLRALGDEHAWRVDVPPEAVVLVEARSGANAPFTLRAHPLGTAEPAWEPPAVAAARLLGPGSWRVAVDPAAGAAVRIDVAFRGHLVDVGGAPASFAIHALEADQGCVVPGACLP